MSDRIISLNSTPAEFSIDELEPRIEMQILGIGNLPGIRQCRWVGGSKKSTCVKYCTTIIETTITITPNGGEHYQYTY